jgi:hypothetical protein
MAASSAATVARSAVVTCESPMAVTRSPKVVLINEDETCDPLKSVVKSLWAWLVDVPPATASASSDMTEFSFDTLKWNEACPIDWPSTDRLSRSEIVTSDLAARLCNSVISALMSEFNCVSCVDCAADASGSTGKNRPMFTAMGLVTTPVYVKLARRPLPAPDDRTTRFSSISQPGASCRADRCNRVCRAFALKDLPKTQRIEPESRSFARLRIMSGRSTVKRHSPSKRVVAYVLESQTFRRVI